MASSSVSPLQSRMATPGGWNPSPPLPSAGSQSAAQVVTLGSGRPPPKQLLLRQMSGLSRSPSRGLSARAVGDASTPAAAPRVPSMPLASSGKSPAAGANSLHTRAHAAGHSYVPASSRELPHAGGSSLQEFLDGDPWEGCEDLAPQGMIDWLADYVQLAKNASLAREAEYARLKKSTCVREAEAGFLRTDMVTCQKDAAAAPSPDRPLTASKPLGGRISIGTVSTAASLGRPSLLSTPGSCGSLPPRQSHGARSADGDKFEDDDTWELEFLMRAGMD
uniref:Uncharacterized protein n=1 Tax=Alexandrium monilatum TaxID=311494 RepID=A0A7S4UZ24_9DINO